MDGDVGGREGKLMRDWFALVVAVGLKAKEKHNSKSWKVSGLGSCWESGW